MSTGNRYLGKVFDIGDVTEDSGLIELHKCSDGIFKAGQNGVVSVLSTGDKKVEFIVFEHNAVAYVKSEMGAPAYYPVLPVTLQKPVKAVLMDLDGTSVKSEDFWISIIQMTVASLLGNSKFEFEQQDLPYISGHSVSEHLSYCITKYAPGKTVEEARKYYFQHTHREMKEILEGRGRKNAFTPADGLKDFLLELKSLDIKVGLVTSGLYEKAWPEIISAFQTLNMGDPKDFYDTAITAGYPVQKGEAGTLGELSLKPHPWLYAEACRIGLGIGPEDRNHVLGIEDSGAGVCSIRLAGYSAVGISGGNIIKSGTKSLCNYYCNHFDDIIKIIKK